MLLACVLGLWTYLRYVGPLPGDTAILLRVQAHLAFSTSQLLGFLGIIGTTSVALVTVAVAVAVVLRALGPLAAAAVLVSSGGVMLNEALRSTLGPTPASLAIFGPLVESYPSGHNVYATTFFGILAWLACKHGRRDAAAILAGLVVAMGPGRVLSGAHLVSDVLGGYLLGGAWLLFVLTAHDAVRVTMTSRTGPSMPDRGGQVNGL